jgi:predicted extracellular nuclease
MKHNHLIRYLVYGLVLTLLVPFGVWGKPASAATGDPVLINEVLASHSGDDDTEFIEFFGIPGTSLDGLSLIVVEGDAGPSQGNIDRRMDFGPSDILGSNGFYLVGNPAGLGTNYGVTPNVVVSNNYLENSSLTVALVQTSSLSGSSVSGSEVVLDAIALNDGHAGDAFFFGAPVIGPDGTYFPAGARRVTDGVDTDTAADWVMSDFYLGSANTPTGGDTPPPPPPLELTIMEIQGSDQFSAYAGERVETTGVVTLISANGEDMWIQHPVGDGNPATSDGIFVDDRDDLDPLPQVGDMVRVTATVEEQQFDNQLPRTRLNNPDPDTFEIISSGNPLPAPVELKDLPNESIAEGIAFWEPLEGMLVSVRNAPVVAATSPFGEFGMLTKKDAKPGSGFYPQTQQILLRNMGGELVDYNPERIMVDDASVFPAIQAMPGDRVRSLVGVVDYTFGMYKLQPSSYDIKAHKLPKLPASTRSGPKGNLVITTFNVENLFDLAVNTGAVIDVIGQVGVDPGSEWKSGGVSTKDNTIRRKAEVCEGDADGTDAFDPSIEWDGYPKDTFDGLGSHSVDCGTAPGLFISEYGEGSSFNKVVEIFNRTETAVNLGAAGFAIEIYFNGSTSPSQTIYLTGTLASGDVFVLAHPSADAAILAVADQTSSGVLFNGDDAVVLRTLGKDDAGSTPTPEELEVQLTKLVKAIIIELELPEILVVQEVENTAILQELGDRINASAGTNYTAVSFETSDARGIEVGFLYDADRVTLIDALQLSGPDVEAAFGPSSPSPGREPLYGEFLVGDETIHIVGNHFKSKSGDDPPFGVSFNRITEVQRKLQAQVVRDFVDGILDADPDALIMVAGDLNDFQFAEPGEGANHPIGILEGVGGGVPFTNLINLEKDAERYTYVYDGNSQVLDHMLISPALYDLYVAVDILHFNAGFPNGLGGDESTPLRASDHDAVEGRFKIK